MKRDIISVLICGFLLVTTSRALFLDGSHHFPGGPSGGFGGGGPVTGGESYYPCNPGGQGYCNLHCSAGYVKGPNGCDFCMCDQHGHVTDSGSVLVDPTTGTPTTTTTITTTIAAARVPSSTQEPVTQDSCAIAKVLCSSRCSDGGYLTDPSDCTFCVCKSDVLGGGK